MVRFEIECREFPGGPVVRTLRFHCPGPRVQSLVGELGSQGPHGIAKKKKKKKIKTEIECQFYTAIF